MKKLKDLKISRYLVLFLSGMAMVSVITFNTIVLNQHIDILVGPVGGFVSFIWCLNVQKASKSNMREILVYSFGAGIGSWLGYNFGNFIKQII
jgi:hypothetical protein